MKKFVLVNGKVVSEKAIIDASVYVEGRKIVAVKKGKLVKKHGYDVIDASGLHILPGLIDVHVHFRTPGLTAKEDWTSGSRSALAGGVTSVLDMPNVFPPTVDAKTLDEKRAVVKKNALVNYGFFVGVTKENIDEIMKLKGIAGYKLFMGSSTGNMLMDDKAKLEELFKKTRKIVVVHAEAEACILSHAAMYRGPNDVKNHSRIRAPECAYEAVREVLQLAKKYRKQVHICHLSTEGEIRIFRKFKSAKITAEVTPHHLFLTTKDYEKYGNLIKVNPPVREFVDQVVLWKGLKNGLIEVVATDHAPHTLTEKMQPYDKAPSGIPGVQTMLPLMMNAVNEKKLKLTDVVRIMSLNPARIFRLKGKGRIAKGMDADLTLVNMSKKSTLALAHLFSKAGWSPYAGWQLKGYPVMTFVGGTLMYEWPDKFTVRPGQSLPGRELKFF